MLRWYTSDNSCLSTGYPSSLTYSFINIIMKEITLNAAPLISVTSLIISTKDGRVFFLMVQGVPVDAKWTQTGPSGEELTMHIKDGYTNRLINVIAVPIMNRDGSVDKATLGNGWLVCFPAREGTYLFLSRCWWDENLKLFEPCEIPPNLQTLLQYTEHLLLIEPVSEDVKENVSVQLLLNTGLLKNLLSRPIKKL